MEFQLINVSQGDNVSYALNLVVIRNVLRGIRASGILAPSQIVNFSYSLIIKIIRNVDTRWKTNAFLTIKSNEQTWLQYIKRHRNSWNMSSSLYGGVLIFPMPSISFSLEPLPFSMVSFSSEEYKNARFKKSVFISKNLN